MCTNKTITTLSLSLAFVCLLLANTNTPSFLAFAPEICGNGIDDDGDGAVDSNDPDCFSCTSGLLSNSGFSSGLTSWIPWGPVTIQTEANGNKYARISGGEGGFDQSLAASAGTIFTVSFLGKNTGAEASFAGFAFYNAAGTKIGSDHFVQVSSASFKQYSLTYTAPANTASIRAIGYKIPGTGTLDLDGFCLRRTEICGNGLDDDGDGAIDSNDPDCFSCPSGLLSNPGFSSDLTSWGNWNNTSIQTEANGNKFARVSGGQGGFAQTLATTAGTNFTVSFLGKNTGAEYSTAGFVFYDASWNQIGSNHTVQVLSSNFIKYSLTYSAPANTAYVGIFGYKNAGAGTLDLDGFCLTALPPEICGNGLDDDGDGYVDASDPDCVSCYFNGWVVYNTSNQLRRYNINNNQDELLANLSRVYGDIGFAGDGTLYAVNLNSSLNQFTIYRLNPATGAHTAVHSGTEVSSANSLSFDELGWAYIGSGAYNQTSQNNKVYRVKPGVTSATLWLDLSNYGFNGYPSGDFIFIDDVAYVACTSADVFSSPTLLLKIENLGADHAVTASTTVTSLGNMGTDVFGLAGNENGDLFGVRYSDSKLIRVQTAPFNVSIVGDLGGQPYGATGNVEASGVPCGPQDEICNNGIDDDFDGAVDSNDPDCFSCPGGLLSNTGFSSGLTGWTAWGPVSVQTEANGNQHARISGAEGGFNQTLAATAGTTFTLSFLGKNTGTESSFAGFAFFDATGTKIGSDHFVQVSSASFQQYSLTYTAPANTASIRTIGYKIPGAGTLDLDGFCLTSLAGEICGNGLDDDSDGAVDSNDPNCFSCADGLLSNPGFSSYLNGWTDWGYTAIQTEANGNQYARVSGGVGGFAQNLAATAGTTYTLSFLGKNTSAADSWAGFAFYDASSTKIGSDHTVQVSSTNFQQYSVTFTAPANAAYITVFGWKNAGTSLDLDGFCLTTSSSEICGNGMDDDSDGAVDSDDPDCFSCTSGLLSNPGFSSNMTDWTDWGYTSIITEANSNQYARVSGGQGGFAQTLAAAAGNTYTLSFLGKNAGTADSWVGFTFFDTSSTIIGSNHLALVSSSSFQQYSVSYTAPANTASIRVFSWKNDPTSTLDLDGFCLTAQLPEICDDGIDNDGDGLTDCADTDCPCYNACTCGSSLAYAATLDRGGDTSINGGWAEYFDHTLQALSYAVNPDGSISITGLIEGGAGATCPGNDHWEVDVTLTDPQNWATFSANGGTYNPNTAGCNDYQDWLYYNISGQLHGLGCNTGTTLPITGNVGNYRVQLGVGSADPDNCAYGLSGWFFFEEGGTTRQGDFYMAIDQACFQAALATCHTLETCGNGIDDDGDGAVDSNDPDCFSCPGGLLSNTEFSSGLTGWTAWGPVSIQTEANGNQHARISGAEGGFEQSLAASAGTIFTLSFLGKNTGAESSLAGFAFYDAAGTKIGSDHFVQVSSASFQQYSLTYTAPANTASIRTIGYKIPGAGTLDLDGCCLTASYVEICDDGIDNDGDGLIDCADPDCSSAPVSISGGGTTICTGGSATLTASGAVGSTFLWSTGATTSAITVSPAITTTYSVTVYNPLTIPDTIPFNAANFSLINSTNSFGGPASLFNGADEISGASFHATRVTNGQTWGIAYQLGGDYKITSLGLDRRNDCCTDRGEGGAMQVYDNGSLVYQSNVLNGTGNGALYATPALSNIVGDEVRYVFLNGANTTNNDAVLNFTEWLINTELVCSATSSATVTVVADPAITAQPTGSTICNGGTATLSVTATGGTPSLSYQWLSSSDNITFNNIAGATSSSYTTPALAATTYYRAMVSASGDGCGSVTSSSAAVTIGVCGEICDNGLDDDGDGLIDCADPDCANSFTVNTNATSGTICRGGNTTISASASGGTGPYTYNWSGGLGSGISHNITPLATTTYTVTVTSAPGCTSTAQVTVTVNFCSENCTDGIDNDGDGLIDCDDPDCGLSLTASPTNATCGSNNGQVSISASGGSGNYEYSSDSITWAGSNLFANVLPGNHTFYVRNGDGACPASVGATVTDGCEVCTDGIDNDGDGLIDCADPDCAPVSSAGPNVSICSGASTMLTATASGGTAPYTFAWSDGLGAGATKTVSPGPTTTYTVTVTSVTGCSSTAQVTVTVTACSEDCTDGIDNDGDGLVDCDDPDCQAIGMPQLVDDVFNTCPGIGNYGNLVSVNDGNLQNPVFTIVTPPAKGTININNFGAFNYTPADSQCGPVSFTYQVCNGSGCCATANAVINFGDNVPPTLQNVPPDITISCDDEVPQPPAVVATDFCPYISISVEDTDDQGSMGACGTYTITRTWTATDICGNTASQSQLITVTDQAGPEVFRVHTLPNGKKMVAGNAQQVSGLWKYVKFPVHFDSPPLVFVQVATENDAAPVTVQTRYISTTGFEVRLREEEAADQLHGGETVSWMATEAGDVDSGYKLSAQLLNNVTHSDQALNYPLAFSSKPVFIASVNGTAQADPVSVRTKAETATGLTVSLQEEQSADSETAHANEKLAWLAMTHGAYITDENGNFVAESGTLSTNHGWATVSLANSFTKPVVLLGGLSSNGSQAATVRVRNVTPTSFEVRVQEWDYLNGIHANETLSYLVVEGSIPTYREFYCFNDEGPLQLGVDVIAIDNCDGQVAFDYTEVEEQLAQGLKATRTWAAQDDCGNVDVLTRRDTCPVAAVRLKTLLSGAVPVSGNDVLMNDALRTKQLVPLKEPYSGLSGFQHHGMGGGETASPNAFWEDGAKAVEDWIFVECRAPGNDKAVLSTCSVLLRRDGSTTTANGDSILYFWDLPEGDYYVAARHRNHLGLMTDGAWYLSSDGPPTVDLAKTETAVRGGSAAGKPVNGKRAMWSGDYNGDGRAIYQGPYNDVFFLFSKVLGDPANSNFLANYISIGYNQEDFDLDGRTIYQGPGNERSLILFNATLAHPLNTGGLANYIVKQGLP
ncbi:MAG: hypothetical protein H6577_13000 [Lewinellaceae bacterium]|nr:hypothetical protein [Lewinellaceae bacterium]